MTSLYQEEILRLAKAAACTPLTIGGAQARLTNPLCGDDCAVRLTLHDGRIDSAAHYTRGCILCLAAAEKLVQLAAATPHPAALAQLAQAFADALTTGTDLPEPLQLFTPVAARKSRHGCVLLPYQALMQIVAARMDGG